MRELSRRELLKLAALGVGAVALDGILAACKAQTTPGFTPTAEAPVASPTPTELETPPATPSPDATPLPTTPPSPTPAASVGHPDLVVARNGEPDALVRSAIAALGGMERFVRSGANVVVKPNICVSYRTYSYAATTNPWVVGTLVKMAYEAGASSVKVMDYPYGGAAADAYAKSGIAQQVQANGGQMVVMSSRKYVSTNIPAGKALKRTDVYDDILKADVLINVPIAKHHGSTRLTLAMKNLMGVVRDRSAMHSLGLSQTIPDLNTLVKSDLTVVDAVRILTSHGPSGGRLAYVKKLDTVIASPDIVAADSYAATLFGLKPTDIGYIKVGGAMGLGRNDLSKLQIEELSV
jgi:uncharacterized protein (DUF362 family)